VDAVDDEEIRIAEEDDIGDEVSGGIEGDGRGGKDSGLRDIGRAVGMRTIENEDWRVEYISDIFLFGQRRLGFHLNRNNKYIMRIIGIDTDMLILP